LTTSLFLALMLLAPRPAALQRRAEQSKHLPHKLIVLLSVILSFLTATLYALVSATICRGWCRSPWCVPCYALHLCGCLACFDTITRGHFKHRLHVDDDWEIDPIDDGDDDDDFKAPFGDDSKHDPHEPSTVQLHAP